MLPDFPFSDPQFLVRYRQSADGRCQTLLLAELYKALKEAGVDIVSGDWEGKRKKDRRTLAILAPTNKAASVLRIL